MKTILIALNAKYIHSSLAIRYLKACNSQYDIETAEFSINDHIQSIYKELIYKNADYYCFSCYIWNIEQVLKIAEMLKQAKPNAKIVLGGPECSYNAKEILEKHPYIDHILIGEGEKMLGLLLSGENSDKIITGGGSDLSELPFPYTDEDFKSLHGKLVYFETSRGCPYKCSYCLSAADTKIRYFPMDYVKCGFDTFFKNNVTLIKLVDRTFNADNKRAIEIINYIKENSKNTTVHLEVEPHLLNPDLIDALSSAPKGMFQLEIGIQTINCDTLSAINRKNDLEVIKNNINTIKKADNMHIHLDLIAGLPYEDLKSFKRSFNYVYSLMPDMLQLGFLKVLHGAPMEQQSGIKYTSFPPYEVIATDWLSAEEICFLKEIEDAVERFYNSGAFGNTLSKIISDDPFSSFENLASILKTTEKNISRVKLYDLLYENYGEEILTPLVYDFLLNNKDYKLPSFVQRRQSKDFKKKIYELIGDTEFLNQYNVKPDLKNLRFEPVLDKVLLTDYSSKIIYDLTNLFM